MSYSCSDQSDLVIQLLTEKGYNVELQVDDKDGSDHWHFTYNDPEAKGDVECGDYFHSELAAWSSALENYFERTDIEFHSVLGEEAMHEAFDARQLATIRCALRMYRDVDSEAAGDIPEDYENLRTTDGAFESLDPDEVEDLIARLAA